MTKHLPFLTFQFTSLRYLNFNYCGFVFEAHYFVYSQNMVLWNDRLYVGTCFKKRNNEINIELVPGKRIN